MLPLLATSAWNILALLALGGRGVKSGIEATFLVRNS